jgi:hemolysin activation/secretion protein
MGFETRTVFDFVVTDLSYATAKLAHVNRPWKITTITLMALLISVAAHGVTPSPAPDGEQPPNGDAAPTADRPEAKAQAEPRFDILEYRVEGNSVLSRGQIERAVYPHLGPRRTIADVERARGSLEKTYRDAGYATVLVDIPEQKVSGGSVSLRVTEGRLSKVHVKGSRYYSLNRIRSQLPALEPGTVPHMPVLQEQLAVVNRASADRQLTPVFRAGDTPGTVEVDLRVRDELPLHASLELNNRYTQDTEKLRLLASLRYDNLWQREHSAVLQYQTAPQDIDQVKVLSANYVFRANAARDVLAFYGVRSDSRVATVGDITVLGAGNVLGARWIRGLKGGTSLQSSLVFGIDAKDFTEDVRFGTDSFQTPIRYYPFTLGYNGSRPDARGRTSFGGSLNFSLRSLSARAVDCGGFPSDQFECKRSGARPNYLYLKGEYQRSRVFENGWGASAHLEGQISPQPLISNEQFSAGGQDSVRGYLESERLGDQASRASFEMRTPGLGSARTWLQELYGLAFIEGASLELKDPLPDQDARFSLASIGLGARFGAWKHLRGEMYWGHALKDGAVTKKGDDRGHFRLEYGF